MKLTVLELVDQEPTQVKVLHMKRVYADISLCSISDQR